MKDDDKKIELIKNKIQEDISLTHKKMKINVVFSTFVSFFIMLLNVSIIGLSIWALIELVKEIVNKKSEVNVIILPTIVALFTICLFIFSILISIYKIKSKVFFYKTVLEEYQYLIIKIKEKNIEINEAVDMLNEINNKKFEYKKLSYKKLAKKVLGG